MCTAVWIYPTSAFHCMLCAMTCYQLCNLRLCILLWAIVYLIHVNDICFPVPKGKDMVVCLKPTKFQPAITHFRSRLHKGKEKKFFKMLNKNPAPNFLKRSFRASTKTTKQAIFLHSRNVILVASVIVFLTG